MSLDVYLESDAALSVGASDKIFVREDGQTVEITREEWDKRHPDREPVVVHDEGGETHTLYSANITHNLNAMAKEAGLFDTLWCPEAIGIQRAGLLIPLLEQGLSTLRGDRARFEAFNPENGWGNYDVLVRFVERYLDACKQHPDAIVSVSR